MGPSSLQLIITSNLLSQGWGRGPDISSLVVLLAAVTCLLSGCGALTPLGCFQDTGNVPTFTVSAINLVGPEIVVAQCVAMCKMEGFVYAGITENATCQCSSDVVNVPLLINSPVLCDVFCLAGDRCGGLVASALSVYSTGGGPLNFTMTVTHTPTVDLKIVLTPVVLATEVYYIDVGTGTEAIQWNTTSTSLTTESYIIPGNYTVAVVGMVDGVSSAYSLTQVVSVPPGPSSVEAVRCPLVWEPAEVFLCNVTVTLAQPGDSFIAKFVSADQTVNSNFAGVGSFLMRIGEPVPLGYSPAMQPSGDTPATVVIFSEYTIARPSLLYAVEFYVMEAGTYNWEVNRPTCAAGKYCVFAGGCMDPCPFDSLNNAYSCAAPKSFCPLGGTCGNAGVCAAPGTPATWTVVTSGSKTATNGTGLRSTLATAVALFPGDTLKITGNLAASVSHYYPGDTVDGVATNTHHVANMVVKELVPVQLSHKCLVVNNDVTLTVGDNTATTVMSNATACQRNITDIVFDVLDNSTDAWDPTLNLVNPYYCWAGAAYPHKFRANFTVAGPVTFTVTFDPYWSYNATLTDLTDYPFLGPLYTVLVPFNIPTEGVYTAVITAKNLHNTYYTAPNNTIVIHALYPVLPNWVMAPKSSDGAFWVPPTLPTFTFTDSATKDFPTNASVLVDWNDGSAPELFNFVHTGNKIPLITHNYTVDGIYNPKVFINNMVSGYNTTCPVTIIEEIQNFAIVNGYFPTPTTIVARGGFGKIKNQYPMDKNLTFFPHMTQGTVERYEVRHTINNSLIFTFSTANLFNPLVDSFSYPFNFETFLNITVVAINQFESKSVDLVLEIVGQVRVLQINDYSIVNKPNEEKFFEFTFESIGGGTCLIIDWGDGGPLESFGEEMNCKTNFSHAIYNPNIELAMSMNFTHTYPLSPDPAVRHQVFNVSAFAYNPMSVTEDMLLFPITDLSCAPPQVTIADQQLNYMEAPTKHRGEDNTIISIGSTNCNITQKTKKRWQILHIDEMNGRVTTPVVIMNIITTWNKSELVIPKRFLTYGYYMALYTLTMWDPPVLDTSVTFQKQTETYFEIIKTPLIGKMTSTSLSKVRRGPTQALLMEPAVYSEDPDFPEVKNFTVAWNCRAIAETYPAPGTPPAVLAPFGGTGTGCFGYGPGPLDNAAKALSITGAEFLKVGTYEFLATVGKDTRTANAIMQVEVVAEDVPMVDVNCITPTLCTPAPDGTAVYVNPTTRLAVQSKCVDVCGDGTTTHWSAVDGNGNVLNLPGDVSSPEMVLEVEAFFKANPGLASFTLTADVTNSAGIVGSTSYYFKVNQPPVAPYHNPAAAPVPATAPNVECQVYPAAGRALVDTFTLTCNSWTDPENIGVRDYKVQLVYSQASPVPPPTVLLEKTHSNAGDQMMSLVFPAATFDIEVVVTDLWDANTVHRAAVNFTASMITEEELAAMDVDALLAALAGAGATGMMTMVIAAQSSVSGQASWLNLTDPSLTPEELKARQLLIAQQNKKALEYIRDNTNFENMGGITAASAAVAQIMAAASASPQAALTIGLDSRSTILDILEKIGKGVEKQEINDMNMLDIVATDIATISAGIVMGYDEILGTEGCNVIPEVDFAMADTMAYDTDIGLDYEMVVPSTVKEAKQCNVKDTTKNGATDTIDRANSVVESLGKRVMSLMVVGDTKTIESGNGMTMCMIMFKGNGLPGQWWCGKSFYQFQPGFCPQGQGCRPPVSSMAKEWPASTYQAPGSASKLADGSKVLDVDLFERDQTKMNIKNTADALFIGLPRTMNKRENNTLPPFEFINATYESANQLIPVMYSTFFVNETQNSATIEIVPGTNVDRLFLVLAKGIMPTLRNNSHYRLVKDLPFVNDTDIREWFLPSRMLGGQGQYFVGVGEFTANVTPAMMAKPNERVFKDVQVLTQNYELRVYTSGCYFRSPALNEWINDNLHVLKANHTRTLCETNHLTSFGSGFVVAPNTIDFSYVFANMGFVDNLTIYVTLMICLAIFILLLIWARWKDGKDEALVGAAPLPDNRPEDKYLYEIIVATGNKAEAQTESLVQFTLTGEDEESEVRTFGDSERKIFQKSATDAFIMATDRPLGNLHFLRIWHDNSGKGPNASWFLAYIVIRDVQTDERFEFICNDWLAMEKTGVIERVLPTASASDKNSIKHLFLNVSNKNIADKHLWFSIFMRPHRSRFTRCQRVGSCFALLFLSMLANAMFYQTVPETPMSGGLNIGPFTMTPEQMGVGLLCDLIAFPPSFLIIFLFRNARPKKLRESRIEKAVDKTIKQLHAKKVDAYGNIIEEPDSDDSSDNGSDDSDDDTPNESSKITTSDKADTDASKKKLKKKRRFALPWWCGIIAWVLVALSIVASLFFLLMYGIMFGQNRATKWITSLVVSFFSSVLIVQPLKIFLIGAFFSVICRNSNKLDEDEVEDDEVSPELDDHQQWMYDGLGQRPKLYRKDVDPQLLARIKKKRLNENEMHEILKELLVYCFFIYVLMTLSAGQRDSSAFLLKENLRNTLTHEGKNPDIDFTGATDTNAYWTYLNQGLFPFLRADKHYNGQSPYQLKGFLNDQANRIMGYAIVRQIRAKKFTCFVHPSIRYITLDCSSYTQIVNEESKDYCVNWKLPTNTTANTKLCAQAEYKYSTATELQSLPIWGNTDWYGGGGYVIRLRGSSEDLLKRLHFLQLNHWIDRMTRAVMLEFSTYNAGTNLFGVATMTVEATPGGGLNPHCRFDAVRLIENQGKFILYTYIIQGLFCLFAFYFTVKEAILFYKQKMKYFDSYWNYAEIGIIISCYAAIILYVMRYLEVNKALAIFNETWGNGYIRITYAVTINEYYGYVLSFMVFVCLLKFIKLLRFNKRIGILSATLRRCWEDLRGFLMAFFLCFFSFVFLFYILLGGALVDFYEFVAAIETSFSMMLGKFDFQQMQQANPLVPLLFFIFVLSNSWVLINLLLTIIIKAFEQVKHDILSQPNEFEMVAFVFNSFKTAIGRGYMEKIDPLVMTTTEKNGGNKGSNVQDIHELPDKMNKFLDFVNDTYFEGSLDLRSKKNMREAMKMSNRQFDQAPRRGPWIGGE